MVVSSEVYTVVEVSWRPIIAWTGVETPTEDDRPAENVCDHPEW
ncbi:hypothetical protein [Streptomyces sp. NPDC001404]